MPNSWEEASKEYNLHHTSRQERYKKCLESIVVIARTPVPEFSIDSMHATRIIATLLGQLESIAEEVELVLKEGI